MIQVNKLINMLIMEKRNDYVYIDKDDGCLRLLSSSGMIADADDMSQEDDETDGDMGDDQT